MSINNPFLDAISTNKLTALRTLLEIQDRQLFTQTAQVGTPETAAYLLSRQPLSEEYSQNLPTFYPTLNLPIPHSRIFTKWQCPSVPLLEPPDLVSPASFHQQPQHRGHPSKRCEQRRGHLETHSKT